MKNKIILDLQLTCNNRNSIPSKAIFVHWIKCIFAPFKKKVKITIRIVTEKESQLLNMYFLKKNFPTNVLSFPCSPPKWINSFLIGDLVICQKIVEYESKINKITIENQMARTVIHGSLHLLKHDHNTDDEIERMQHLENKILKKLKYQ